MENESFEIVSGIDDNTVVITTNLAEEEFNRRLEQAVRNYGDSDRYASIFNPDTAVSTTTLAEISELAVDPQNSIEKTRKIARIVDTYINKNYLLGMVDSAIRSNLNTKYKASYSQQSSKLGRNMGKKQDNAKKIVEDMLDQINVKKLIRMSIPKTFSAGNFFFYMDIDSSKGENIYTLHIFPLSVARVAPYRIGGEPILMIDMRELQSRLEHNLPKRKGGKAMFFQKYEEEITKAYPKEIVEAFRNKDNYAILDYKRTGVMRAGEDNDGASLYGVSQMLRALSDIIVLDNFANVDDTVSKVKAKNILVQLLRKELLGAGGDRQTFKETAFAHGELTRAVKQKICVYTGTAAVEDVKWVDPKNNFTDTNSITLYENRVLSTLGIGFLAYGGSGTTVSANISLKQLMRQINYISEQLEHILEKFAIVALQENGLGVEYAPSFSIIDSEQLDEEMRIELAKFMYSTLACSRRTVFETLDIDINDESERRMQENNDGVEEIFRPYMTAYTNNGDKNTGREPDSNSNNEVKQENDKQRNEVK